MDSRRRIDSSTLAGEFDAAAKAVSTRMLETFTATGSKEHCRRMVQFYLDNGVYPIVYPLPRHGRVLEDMKAGVRLAVEYARRM